MEDLIMKIIDIEDRAKEVISDARKADKEIENRIKDETRKMQNDIEGKIEAKTVTLRKIEQEEADRRIKTINDDMEKHLSELEEKYSRNRDKWINEIIENIIGR